MGAAAAEEAMLAGGSRAIYMGLLEGVVSAFGAGLPWPPGRDAEIQRAVRRANDNHRQPASLPRQQRWPMHSRSTTRPAGKLPHEPAEGGCAT